MRTRQALLGLGAAAALLLADCGARPYRVFAVQVASAAKPAAFTDGAEGGLRPVGYALSAPQGRAATPRAAGAGTPWDLNQVSVAALQTLPGMDAATAQAIVAHRPYRSKRELLSKHVVTAAQYARWKGALVVHRSRRRAGAVAPPATTSP